MQFACQSCGGFDFTFHGTPNNSAILLSCVFCKNEARVEGAAIMTDEGEILEASALPDNMAAVGNDPDDPWVWFRARMKRSQREKVHEVMDMLSQILGRSQHAGTALEYMAAEFISTYRGNSGV